MPLLGVDLLRDARDGRLYVAEVNSSGNVWAFSSAIGRAMQERLGASYESQFDAMARAARVLVDETRRRAL